MIRIDWFGNSNPYSARIAKMAFLIAIVHFNWYIMLGMVLPMVILREGEYVKTEIITLCIRLASVMLLVALWAASTAERRMFLPKECKWGGILAWCYWLILVAFYGVVCIQPDIYLLFFPDVLDAKLQSLFLFSPAVLFGILELTLGNKYFRKQDWESDGDQTPSQSSTNQEPSV